MNTCLFASVENTWLLAGWTMIHFLWLGTLVALAGLLSRWLLRRTSPRDAKLLASNPIGRSIHLVVRAKIDEERLVAFPSEQHAEVIVDAECPVGAEVALQLVGP